MKLLDGNEKNRGESDACQRQRRYDRGGWDVKMEEKFDPVSVEKKDGGMFNWGGTAQLIKRKENDAVSWGESKGGLRTNIVCFRWNRRILTRIPLSMRRNIPGAQGGKFKEAFLED